MELKAMLFFRISSLKNLSKGGLTLNSKRQVSIMVSKEDIKKRQGDQ